MSDAYAVWRAGAGTSKQKSVGMIWPDLAKALGGLPGDAPSAPVEPQPLCSPCFDEGTDRKNVLAIGRAPDGTPICGWHVGVAPYRGKRLRRVNGWAPGRARMVDDE
jgi:hypothetical protein